MKTTPIPLLLSFGLLLVCGCTDGNITKRNDGRFVTIPAANQVVTAPDSPAAKPPLPGETGRQFAADKALATTVVGEESPAQQKQREAQEKLEDDLSKLDSK